MPSISKYNGSMRPQDLDIDLLRHFVTIAETGGFTAAGEVLGRTQSAVSLKVRKLEEVLGKRVFHRTSRSTELTVEGEVLLGFARRLLELNDETLRRVQEPEVEGTLRLGVAEHFVGSYLPKVLRGFCREYPRISLEISVGLSGALLAKLDAGELDLVIAKRERGSTRGRLLWREPLVWVAKSDFDLKGLKAVPLAVLPSPCSYRQQAIAALERMRQPWQVICTSGSVACVLAAVSAGVAVSVVSQSVVQPGLRVLTPAEGFAALPEAEVAVFGQDTTRSPVAKALAESIFLALVRPPVKKPKRQTAQLQ
jgi:DNA-binding transcriptional LysR family regulator